ncbi:hypothetical protein BDW22DRAFT_1430210 [Trametopsis cervina]|nr:hypothetical protein BDW22DRAFT_1430210 [Trametopsis cervina]
MADSTTAPTLQSLGEDLMGPLLLCVCAAILLYGIFLAQMIYYWSTYGTDTPRLKLWVAVLGVLETTHTAVCIHVLYYYFVSHYGQFDVLAQIVWSSGVSVTLEVVIVGFTQAFYVYRIWHITNKNKAIIAALSSVVLGCIGVGFATSSLALKYDTWLELETSAVFRATGNSTWALCVLADTMITGTLVYYLWRGRTASIGRTKKMIRKLIHYSISTGAVTAVASLVVLICYNALPQNILFGGLLEILTKLYANSALAMLNARRRVASSAAPTTVATATAARYAPGTVELSRLQWAAASSVTATTHGGRSEKPPGETTGFGESDDAFDAPMHDDLEVEGGEVKGDVMTFA